MVNPIIVDLWNRFFREGINPEEKETLAKWMEESAGEEDLNQLLEQSWNEFQPGETIAAEKAQDMLASILNRAKELEKRPAPVIPMKPVIWKRITVAASVLFVLGAAAYFLFNNKQGVDQAGITKTNAKDSDIPSPLKNRASIVLANGSIVYLDSAADGILMTQGGVELMKTADGKISYNPSSSGQAAAVIYNTLTNPRGSNVIDMTLTDGSRVWLNAGSSVTYPVAFTGNERKVSITGEAYFEVAHDAAKPFYVTRGEMSVQVLGTHFNVNAYDDEADIRVTLLEGSVKVQLARGSGLPMAIGTVVLKPGEQSSFNIQNLEFKINPSVDIEQVMAWKDGRFEFAGNDIGMVMRQIARWYDVEVVYEGPLPVANFRGGIGRAESVLQVLKMLELTESVKFRIENKKVIVTRWKQ